MLLIRWGWLWNGQFAMFSFRTYDVHIANPPELICADDHKPNGLCSEHADRYMHVLTARQVSRKHFRPHENWWFCHINPPHGATTVFFISTVFTKWFHAMQHSVIFVFQCICVSIKDVSCHGLEGSARPAPRRMPQHAAAKMKHYHGKNGNNLWVEEYQVSTSNLIYHKWLPTLQKGVFDFHHTDLFTLPQDQSLSEFDTLSSSSTFYEFGISTAVGPLFAMGHWFGATCDKKLLCSLGIIDSGADAAMFPLGAWLERSRRSQGATTSLQEETMSKSSSKLVGQ